MFVDYAALSKLFEKKGALRKRYGSDMERKLSDCLISLLTANSLADYLPPYSGAFCCHQLIGDRKDQFSMKLVCKYRLIFEPIFQEDKSFKDGINWKDVNKIRLVEISEHYK